MSGQPPFSSPMPPQPFRFWLPFRSNVALSRPRAPPRTTVPASPRTPPPPPPTPAEASSHAAPASAGEQEIPIQSDPSEELDTIPVQSLDSPPAEQEQSSNRDTKIAISGFPRSRLFDGGRAPYRCEIEDGLKSLSCGVRPPPCPRGDQDFRIITLAGHNVGASMVLGSKVDTPRTGEHESQMPSSASPAVAANVNSNVQSVNNSAVEASTCSAGDPGVRVDVRSEREAPVVVMEKKEKPGEPIRRPPIAVATAEKPPRGRRCLRALMMESGSETEGRRRPRRPGCRFRCVEDHAPPAPATASSGGSGAGAEEDGK